MELDYDQGLERLRGLLPPDIPSMREKFSPLETRLMENLAERQYGRDDTNTAQRNRIIHELNKFMSRELHLSIHFIDLCKPDSQAYNAFDEQSTERQPTPRYQLVPWQEGNKVSVQGQDYWIDSPMQRQWLNQARTLYQQAPGRHTQSGQKVWLKQCQISRSHEAALILKRDLEKEGRLLLKLQQEGQRDFPQWLGSENTTHSATLAYERLAGRSLAAAFDSLPKPLNSHTTRRLLAGRHTLIQMLYILHNKMNCVHRMLTPETLLLQTDSNRIILPDVGLATRTVQPGEGPQFYQAPEQLRGLPVPDRTTDIYQLGALFYHLLTGQHITDTVTAQASGLTPELDMLLRKAAAPFPRDRWPNVHAFSQALHQLGY